jgi:hypothetical protein
VPAIAAKMTESDINRLQQELDRLMNEHIENLKKQAFVRPSEDQLRESDERLKRIREISAEYVALLTRVSALPEN